MSPRRVNKRKTIGHNRGNSSPAKSEKRTNKQSEKDARDEAVYIDTPEYFDLVFGLCQMFEEIDINGNRAAEIIIE